MLYCMYATEWVRYSDFVLPHHIRSIHIYFNNTKMWINLIKIRNDMFFILTNYHLNVSNIFFSPLAWAGAAVESMVYAIRAPIALPLRGNLRATIRIGATERNERIKSTAGTHSVSQWGISGKRIYGTATSSGGSEIEPVHVAPCAWSPLELWQKIWIILFLVCS